MSTVEQDIIDRLHQFDPERQRWVLDFIEQLKEQPPTHYSPRELMRLPAAQRDQIVAEAFRLAQNQDFEIFEAHP